MSSTFTSTIATIGIDLGKNTFHLVGLDRRGAIVLQLKLSRGQLERRLANVPRCLIGMEACSGSHHIGRRLTELGHDVRLIPALATAATERASALPNVPSMVEAGIPDFDTSLWFGLMAPAGTPQPVIDKVAAAAGKAMRAPEALETLKKQGFNPIGQGPDRFGPYLRSEITRWSAVGARVKG